MSRYADGCSDCGSTNDVRLVESWTHGACLNTEAFCDFFDIDPCEAICAECFELAKNEFLGNPKIDNESIDDLAKMETLTDKQADNLLTLVLNNATNHKSFSSEAYARLMKLVKLGAAAERQA